MVEKLAGKLLGDKGYIKSSLVDGFYNRGLNLLPPSKRL